MKLFPSGQRGEVEHDLDAMTLNRGTHRRGIRGIRLEQLEVRSARAGSTEIALPPKPQRIDDHDL